ncbi:hypothetical protein [Novosphingopyxis sp.]|uniref:hypothetical protein n=1 Tax=Novosphingopyxis sp. TaxID=2709690 RepID=UPI003B5A6082
MSGTLSKLIMVIAISCLGVSRREWALAMLAEFKPATEAGHPLSYSLACLVAALREMPKHQEGRRMLARYGLVLTLLLPFAAMLLAGALAGYPFIDLPDLFAVHPHAVSSWMPGGVNGSNRFSIQTLTVLFLLLSARHVLVAWFVVEREWARAGAAQRFGAAMITTLALFTGVLMREATSAILPSVTLAIELLAVTALAAWHDGAGDQNEPDRENVQNYLAN